MFFIESCDVLSELLCKVRHSELKLLDPATPFFLGVNNEHCLGGIDGKKRKTSLKIWNVLSAATWNGPSSAVDGRGGGGGGRAVAVPAEFVAAAPAVRQPETPAPAHPDAFRTDAVSVLQAGAVAARLLLLLSARVPADAVRPRPLQGSAFLSFLLSFILSFLRSFVPSSFLFFPSCFSSFFLSFFDWFGRFLFLSFLPSFLIYFFSSFFRSFVPSFLLVRVS